MTQNEQSLILLVRAGLGLDIGRDTAVLESAGWEEVLSYAMRHNVAAVAMDGAVILGLFDGLDGNLKIKWSYLTSETERRYARQEAVINWLSAFYASHGIMMMVLKGYGLSLMYPRREHRQCSDIDIWLFGEQKRADALLAAEKNVKVDNGHHHHTVFHVGGIMVENHYDFLNIHSHTSNRRIEEYLREFSGEPCECVSVRAEGNEKPSDIYLPSPDMNALFLLRHAAAHFAAAGISLRHVADWALFLRNCSERVDWDKIDGICREMNMHKFMYSFNSIAAELLMLNPDNYRWGMYTAGRNGVEQLKDRMFADIMSPEYGRKAPSGVVAYWKWMFERWRSNSWKHGMVYNESLFRTFWVQLYSHLMKPKTLFGR